MLKIERVSCVFDGVKALNQVSFSLNAGEIIGLIGPNGSGKSTLFNLLTGLYLPSSGKAFFQGKSILGKPAHFLSSIGISRTFQTPRFYQRMTVKENLAVARHALANNIDRTHNNFEYDLNELLNLAGLAGSGDRLTSELSLPDQRKLELVRTQVGRSKLILLDEPTAGMTPRETDETGALLRRLMSQGQSCIIIDHKIELIRNLCPRTVVLNHGNIIANGPTVQVLEDEAVVDAYWGLAK